nr:dihydropteroate synthase [Candidatus Sigynarchaeota archaeon]
MRSKNIHVAIHGLHIGDDYPVRIMGVLNLSTESFYKKSIVQPGTILAKAKAMIAAGATMLDVGGRSTAPHAPLISVEEEKNRVEAALNLLLQGLDNDRILISIDTQYKAVADYALNLFQHHGKEEQFIINDVSGLRTDKELARWVADVGKPIILMASHGKPGDSLGVDQTLKDLSASLELLERLGYNSSKQSIIDPAVGRWIPERQPLYDLEILHELNAFRAIRLPILVAVSRKSFIGEILGEKDPDNRFFGTLSATAIAVFNGAHVIRTHDVDKETNDVIKVAEAIARKKIVKEQS